MFITKTELKLYFNKSLIFGAVVLALLSLAAGLLGDELLYKEKLFPKITLYVADNDGSPESRLLTESLVSFKKDILEVKTAAEEPAAEAVKSGTAAAAIIIPKNFFADIMAGENSDASMLINTKNSAQAEIIKLMAFSVKEQLSAAQAGIYYVLSKAENNDAYTKYFNEINFAFLSVFMGRSMESETISAFGAVSNKDYFTFCFYGFMMFLTSCLLIENGNIIKKGNAAAMLMSKGIGFRRLFAFKALSVLCVFLVLNLPIFGLMLYTGILAGIGSVNLIALLVLASFAQAAFCILFIWLFSEIRSAGVSVFIIQLACLFFSGGLIPLLFLPDALKKLCFFTPNFHLTSLFISMRAGTAGIRSALALILFSILAVGLSYFSASRQLKSEAGI